MLGMPLCSPLVGSQGLRIAPTCKKCKGKVKSDETYIPCSAVMQPVIAVLKV